MIRTCRNIYCESEFTIFNKYAKSTKPSRHFFCRKCRLHSDKIRLKCIACNNEFQPDKLSQVYCSINCKIRQCNRRAYNKNRLNRAKRINCKFCNIEIPCAEIPRKRICVKCEEGFIKRLNDMKCMLCGVNVKSKMYCSPKCRGYANLITARNNKNDGVL